ncbi:glycosyltransferase family 2 protein [Sanguibacter sp. Z1732]|uniref:glycosyltransferase family 2 protein n=1 Tax=Sanguibacter sp. Z1732 TaxID=3435412 RepID=UPI003D9C9838
MSIIVPTYESGDSLLSVVRSLDEQTMPASDFEVIYVDDGSPDGTYQRLEAMAAERSNVRTERIGHSGWPSRPRNVGLTLARGEYVLFMDHDDALYPQALERAYEIAARNKADVVNGKEVRTDQPKWAIESYSRNAGNIVGQTERHPLLPTNPHKLYRRGFLNEHGIRFPEGARVLWEDVYFNIDVSRHAEVVSVLADTPFYRWIRDRETASSTYRDDPVEYWRGVRRIIEYTVERLDGPARSLQRHQMLAYQFRHRVATAIDVDVARTSDERRVHLAEIFKVLNEDYDAALPQRLQARVRLAREGHWSAVERLVQLDTSNVGLTTTRSVRWEDDYLAIETLTRWDSGLPGRLRAHGDRVYLDVPSEITELLPSDLLDVTEEVRTASTEIGIRGRASLVSWMLPTEQVVELQEQDDERALVTVRATARLRRSTGALGSELAEPTWDFTARNQLFDAISQRGLRTDSTPQVALVNGHAMISYRNKRGMLSVDFDQATRSIAGSADLAVVEGHAVAKGLRRRTIEVDVPLRGVHIEGESRINSSVRLHSMEEFTGSIVADNRGARLVAKFRRIPGEYRLSLQTDGRDVPTGVIVTVPARGAPFLTQG